MEILMVVMLGVLYILLDIDKKETSSSEVDSLDHNLEL